MTDLAAIQTDAAVIQTDAAGIQLEKARACLQQGDRRGALTLTVLALSGVEPAARAAAFHQVAVLIDDNPFPTHDETAWRATVAAYRAAPDQPFFRAQAVRRTLLRFPYLQLFRSFGNVFLYAGMLPVGWGRGIPFSQIVLVPLVLPLLLPGVLMHGMANLFSWILGLVLGRRIARGLRDRPEDSELISDLMEIVAEGSAQPEAAEPGQD